MRNIKHKLRQLLDKTNYVKQLHKEISALNNKFLHPPGHFYSPVVAPELIKQRESEIWNESESNCVAAIDLNTDKQLELINQLSLHYNQIPFKEDKQPGLRYYFNNEFYTYTDAVVLFCMIRHFNPKQIMEIGSGFSSAVMLDTNEIFFKNSIQLTFVEPYAERLYSLMSATDKNNVAIIERDVQSISLNVFSRLEKGDFLFIDSSHVVKTGSDVNYILFKILPELKSGVIIHFHDVFFPFEYPKDWVLKGISWNEDYFLRAFLMYNTKFEILLFSEYLHRFYTEVFNKMPLCYKNFGGNFWMVKN